MPSKKRVIDQAAKQEARNTALSAELKAKATEYGVVLAQACTAQSNTSDMFRKAAVALSDMQHEHKIGKLSDPAAMFIEQIGRSAWHEIHKHMDKAAPEYKRGDNSTINMGLMKLTKISKAFSVDGYITNEKTGEKWAVKAALLDALGKERGFNAAVKLAYEINARHDYLGRNDLEYASATGWEEPKANGRPSNKKASDKTVDLVSSKVRVMDAEQCFEVIGNAGAQLVMFVSPTDPSRVDTMQRINGIIREACASVRKILAESAAAKRVAPSGADGQIAQERMEQVAQLESAPPVETVKPKRTRKAKAQPDGVGQQVAA